MRRLYQQPIPTRLPQTPTRVLQQTPCPNCPKVEVGTKRVKK